MGNTILIYGAYGYTGELISRLAVEQGLRPILAGRNHEKTAQLANELSLDFFVFDAQNRERLTTALESVEIMLNCAGPFATTTKHILPACIKTKTHYLDITGEIEVFEYAKNKDSTAKEANIMLMPGVGFDVVPSDCLAAFLAKELPTATHLELAFFGLGGVSQGTALTMLRNIDKGGAIRENGQIKSVQSAYEVKEIDYGIKKLPSVSIPWGDVSTAHFSTGIPNIKVFMAQPSKNITFMKASRYFGWLLSADWMQDFLKKQIKSGEKGPSEEKRKTSKSYLWSKVNDGAKSVEGRLVTPEGYQLTAITSLLIAKKVQNKNFKAGYQTPSSAYGADLILEVEGTERRLV